MDTRSGRFTIGKPTLRVNVDGKWGDVKMEGENKEMTTLMIQCAQSKNKCFSAEVYICKNTQEGAKA